MIHPVIDIVTTTPENDYICLSVGCFDCREYYEFGTSLSGYKLWCEGREPIQKALRELPAPLREMLISGTCPECWDAMFKDCDDDEDYTL